MDIFSFDEGSKEPSEGKKIECVYTKADKFKGGMFSKLSFLAKGVYTGSESSRFWMPYIYPIKFEGEKYLAATNGSVIHYIPSKEKSVFEVEKNTKNEIVLKEAKCSRDCLDKSASLLRAMPLKENLFELKIDSDDIRTYPREFLFAIIKKLSGDRINFQFNYICNFIDSFCNYWGEVRIYAPKGSPYHPWRLEFWNDRGRNFCYGMVVAVLNMPTHISVLTDLYPNHKDETDDQPKQYSADEDSSEDEAPIDTDAVDAETPDIEDDGTDSAVDTENDAGDPNMGMETVSEQYDDIPF